jgi:hypothetical protein
VFAAAFNADDGMWDVDVSCGMQRWHGPKTGAEVGAALKRCGFPQKWVERVLRSARKVHGKWCPRFGG